MVTTSFIVSFSLLMTITTGHDVSLCFVKTPERDSPLLGCLCYSPGSISPCFSAARHLHCEWKCFLEQVHT